MSRLPKGEGQLFNEALDAARESLIQARRKCWKALEIASGEEQEVPLYFWTQDTIAKLLTIDNEFLTALEKELKERRRV